MSDAVLQVLDVHKTFHQGGAEVHVLKGVDLSVRPGELLAVTGPSGAGKSTLLSIAGMLESADTGDVIVDSVSSKALTDQQRTAFRCHHMGFVYQFHYLLPEFTAFENVFLPQRLAGTSVAAATTRTRLLLDRLGLSHRLDHRPAALSGGEQQRVALARALANEPVILLADEPTGNLDPEAAATVFDLLLELARGSGLAAIIVTHNIGIASRLDRIVALKDGRVVPA